MHELLGSYPAVSGVVWAAALSKVPAAASATTTPANTARPWPGDGALRARGRRAARGRRVVKESSMVLVGGWGCLLRGLVLFEDRKSQVYRLLA